MRDKVLQNLSEPSPQQIRKVRQLSDWDPEEKFPVQKVQQLSFRCGEKLRMQSYDLYVQIRVLLPLWGKLEPWRSLMSAKASLCKAKVSAIDQKRDTSKKDTGSRSD